jgi:hypothetical protein
VKKLKIEELHVESFATSAQPERRGTVIAHYSEVDYITCLPIYCQTQPGFATCNPDQCTGQTQTGTTSQNSPLCGGTDPGTNCCDPYGPSLAATNCNDTLCCV